MKINSEVVTAANPGKPQLADLNAEPKLMPPYLRYSTPAERAQIEAKIRAAKRELLLSGPKLDANAQAVRGLVAESHVCDPKVLLGYK